jgi:membrane protein
VAALGSNVDRFVGRQRRAIASEQWAADKVVLSALNTVVPIAIFTLLFAAIYRVLPDTNHLLVPSRPERICHSRVVHYRQVGDRRGALIVLMFWAYYSSQVFLCGAELTEGDR